MNQKFDEIYIAMYLPSINQKSSQKKDTDIAKKFYNMLIGTSGSIPVILYKKLTGRNDQT